MGYTEIAITTGYSDLAKQESSEIYLGSWFRFWRP